jgi:hypothetical protein
MNVHPILPVSMSVLSVPSEQLDKPQLNLSNACAAVEYDPEILPLMSLKPNHWQAFRTAPCSIFLLLPGVSLSVHAC